MSKLVLKIVAEHSISAHPGFSTSEKKSTTGAIKVIKIKSFDYSWTEILLIRVAKLLIMLCHAVNLTETAKF